MTFNRSILMFLGALCFGCALSSVVAAAPIQPFDAVVQSTGGEEIYVRSGPSQEKHYPTMKLSNGDKVHVLRKDPGGWFMIDPPPGSYSWILSTYVQRNGKQGFVKENGVLVRVGAFNSTQRDIEQVRLNKGDTVEILGEQILDSDKGKDLWLKIAPPRGERRWIKGSYLVELNTDGTPKVLAKAPDSKIKAIPESPQATPVEPPAKEMASNTKPRTATKSPAIASNIELDGGDAPRYGSAPRKRDMVDPFVDLPPGTAVAPTLGSQSEEQTILEDLKLLDHELQQILKQQPIDWELGTQREDLESLKELAGKSPVATQIDQRLAKLDEYQGLHDQALIQQKQARAQRPQGTQSLNSAPPNTPAPRVTQETQRFNTPPAAPPLGPSSASRPANSRFDGAGIVHRLPNAPPGTPRYVIAAPDRRILCYLDAAPGVNLDLYVGQAMGLIGQRGYDARLRADRMQVRSLTPVQLAR